MFLSSPKALLTAYTGHQEQAHASPFISAFISSFLHLEIFFKNLHFKTFALISKLIHILSFLCVFNHCIYDKHTPRHRHQGGKTIKYLEEAGSPLTANGLCQSSPAPEQMGSACARRRLGFRLGWAGRRACR